MAKPLASYFENKREAMKALRKYSVVADQRNWTIRDSKLYLYRWAKEAFCTTKKISDVPSAFSEIFRELRNKWQVFRPNTNHWNEGQVFFTFVNHCSACSRKTDLTLKSNLLAPGALSALKGHLETLKEIKTTRYYPTMPVSKFSHFFNPQLFPIYDTAVVYNLILTNVFKKDWNTFSPSLPADFDLDGKAGIWDAYYWIALGSDMIRRVEPSLMSHFAEWFVEESKSRRDDLRDLEDELPTYYATAFEFIAIGAAYLNF